MQVSHLVVNGCSFTYCQGLERPNIDGWPALVAEEFKIPVVNLAMPGSGNDGVFRRTYEYVFEDMINENNPFFIIAWSQTWRQEAWAKKIYNSKIRYDGYQVISFPTNKPRNLIECSLLKTWSEENFYRKTMLYRLSLDSLFKSRNYEYLSSFFAEAEFNDGKNECKQIINSVKNRFNYTTDYLEKFTNRLEDFFKIAGPYPKLKCGHEGIEGNKVLADYIIKEIKLRYNSIEFVEKKYLSLKDYLEKTDLNEAQHHWT